MWGSQCGCIIRSRSPKRQLQVDDLGIAADFQRWPPRSHSGRNIEMRLPFFLVSPADLKDFSGDVTERPELAVVRVPR